jgi:hypothetical protein
MAEGRPPWWVLLLGIANLLFLGFACYVHITGPEPVGWTLQWASDLSSGPALLIASVEPGSAAARAELRPGDLLLESDLRRFLYHEEVGRQYRFEVRRATGGRDTVSVVLNRPGLAYWLGASGAGLIGAVLVSVLNLLLAAIIVFARPRDAVARLGALTLAVTSAFVLWYGWGKPPGIVAGVRSLPVAVGSFLLIAPTLASAGPPILITFMGVFPRSIISKRWLQIFWSVTLVGIPVPVYGVWVLVYAPDVAFNEPRWLPSAHMIAAMIFCFTGACLLARNYFTLKDPNERRRVRIVVTGLLVSTVGFVLLFATVIAQKSPSQFQPFSTSTPLPWLFPLLFAVAPACMAYAILRHRIFDIRIMIRQGIQYAAARGLLLSAVPVLAVLLALDLLLHGTRPLVEVLRQRGWLYLVSGALAFLLHARQHTWLAALDRRFFRERYNAQRVLREVVEEVRASRDFEKASRRVVAQIEATLHSETAAVMLRQPRGAVYRVLASAPAPPPAIPADSKIMGLVRLLAKPVEIPQTDTGWLRQQLPRDESEFLRQARLEWLFPISLGVEGAEAILAVGPKRSEEPYSREDQDLIQAIAASLALLLERSPIAAEPAAGFHECPQCGACYDSGVSQCVHEGAKLTPVMLPPLLARRYHFERRLGQGGMGTVYEARDNELERRVAVKLIRPELMAGPDAVSRFKREARAAAALSHPNVVTVFDFGVGEDERAYLVMELLRGHTLRRELELHGRLGARRAGEIMRGVCGAVETAHMQRLLHRDLKPENIFLINLGGAEVAKVLDFGLAKPLAVTEETATVVDTAPGILVGTKRYMSPEQLSGGPPNESWDLWALAVVAYEILIGTYPFAAEGAGAWHRAVLAGRVIPPHTHLQDAPASWDSFFGRALAVDVDLRPSSATQFAAEFQKIVT